MRILKIAFLSPFYPYRGGIAEFSDSLFLNMKAISEIKAYTFKRMYPGLLFPGTSQYVPKGSTRKDINAEQTLDSINPLTYFSTSRTIEKYKPDLLLTSYWMPFFAPSIGIVSKHSRKKGTKVISILHNVIPHEHKFGDRTLTKYFLRRCDGYVVLNTKSRDELLELKPDAKWILYPHPIYDHYGKKIDKQLARQKLNIPSDKKVILFFGLIRNYKGLDILIESLKELENDYLLLVVGEVYGNFSGYQSIINKYNLTDKVRVHRGFIPDYEVPDYFSASDVCVLPYRTATQSGITGMAYHFEIPLIVSLAGGLHESVNEDNTGLTLPELSPDYLAATIRKLFDGEKIPAIQENMRKFKSKYSWNELARLILHFYENL